MTIEFGRPVTVDELRLTLRADFPHDSYWTQATVAFDDGSREVLQLTKTAAPQVFALAPRTVQSLKLFELKKAADASPFPALTQIEVWGTEGRLYGQLKIDAELQGLSVGRQPPAD